MQLNFKGVAEEANDKHMTPWSALIKVCSSRSFAQPRMMCTSVDDASLCLLQEYNLNTPLSPYLDIELLYNNALSVDGSAIEGIGFSYEQPAVTEALLRESVQYWIDIKAFPPLLQ